ncbi:MAG TPA: hypothetical protein VJ814_00790, partial [Gaiellaceae bacterium]|nr:hypothetical protein [Gaiellaceae bacterium]
TTSTPPPAPTTPEEAIALTRAAIAGAESSGELDPKAGDDLEHRLDDIGKSVQKPDPTDAAHKVADLQHQLSALSQTGKLTADGLAEISTPLNQLAALLPAATKPPGKHKGH